MYLEIKQLLDAGYKDFYFADPNFIGPGENGKKRIIELLKLIRPLEITFGMETRSSDLDAEIMEELILSGFKSNGKLC